MFNGTLRFCLVDTYDRGLVFFSSLSIFCIGRLTDSGLSNTVERIVSDAVGNSKLRLSAVDTALASILLYRDVANCIALILSTSLSLLGQLLSKDPFAF